MIFVAGSMKDAENLHSWCGDPVEEDVLLDDNAAETRTEFLAGAAHQGKLAEQGASVVDGRGKSLGCLRATLLKIVEERSQVGFGLVGANDRKDLAVLAGLALLPDTGQGLFRVERGNLSPVGLLDADGDRAAEFIELLLVKLLTLQKEAQAVANHFARRLVLAALNPTTCSTCAPNFTVRKNCPRPLFPTLAIWSFHPPFCVSRKSHESGDVTSQAL